MAAGVSLFHMRLVRMRHYFTCDSFICVITHVFLDDILHSLRLRMAAGVWFDHVWLILAWHYITCDSFMCDITHLFLESPSVFFIFMTNSELRHTHEFWWICAMTHSHGTWRFHMTQSPVIHPRLATIIAMTHTYVTWLVHMGHDSFI